MVRRKRSAIRSSASSQIVADGNAAVEVEPRRSSEVDVGASADRQHDEIGGNLATIGETNAGGALDTENFLSLAVEDDRDAAAHQVTPQQFGSGGIEPP